jgi:hypothetical protein
MEEASKQATLGYFALALLDQTPKAAAAKGADRQNWRSGVHKNIGAETTLAYE